MTTREEALAKIEELKRFVENLDKEDEFIRDVRLRCEDFLYPCLRIQTPNKDGDRHIVSWRRIHESTLVGTYLCDVVIKHHLSIRFVKEEGGRIFVHIT